MDSARPGPIAVSKKTSLSLPPSLFAGRKRVGLDPEDLANEENKWPRIREEDSEIYRLRERRPRPLRPQTRQPLSESSSKNPRKRDSSLSLPPVLRPSRSHGNLNSHRRDGWKRDEIQGALAESDEGRFLEKRGENMLRGFLAGDFVWQILAEGSFDTLSEGAMEAVR